MAENRRTESSPERAIAASALAPGITAVVLALAIGALVHVNVGVSAALGAAVVVAGFCGQVLALGWARTVSPAANQAVALFGFLVLLGFVGGVYAPLNAGPSWFAPKAFGAGLLA